jgi:hypothetical protein
MPPSLGRQFYDRIVNADDPVAAIRALISSDTPTFEDDVFDCKREPTDPDKKKRRQNLLAIWSKAMCGFANAAGGVVIWGLVAETDPDKKVDKVTGEALVEDPDRLEADLRKLQTETTDPPLGGLLFKAFKTTDASGKPGGFLACFIPDGPHKPYRQRACDEQYYYRFGDTTRVMPRHMLQLLFYPRSKAVLRLDVELTWVHETPSGQLALLTTRGKMRMRVSLTNVGPATARNIFLLLKPDQPPEPWLASVAAQWAAVRDTTYFLRGLPLHPRMPASEVATWGWPIELSRGRPTGPNLRVPFEVYCNNQEPQRFEAVFDVSSMALADQVYKFEATQVDPS